LSADPRLDLVIENVRVVRPGVTGIETLDLGVKDGKFRRIERDIPRAHAREVHDARNLLGFPGVIDAHTHVGIYQHVAVDAPTESAAAATGGVTAMLTYFRTGGLYLDRGGPYREFFPELLQLSRGAYHVDYGYHLAPIAGMHVGEMEMLLDAGVPNFKIFMFYGLHGLHGRSDQQHRWLHLGPADRYDLAHFERIMREAARLQAAHPERADVIAVNLHCETPELLNAYTAEMESQDRITGLEAYHHARPPHSEALAVMIAANLASITGCRNINLLHLSSRMAVEAAVRARAAFPDINIGIEATAGHLLLDYTCRMGVLAKVNPPLRAPDDREYLWERVKDGTIQWIVTDHANCPESAKIDADDRGNVWKAKSGFGGSEYLLPAIFSEATKRGLPANRVAELLCWNPSRRFGVFDKGDIAVGFDADLALIDPDARWIIHHTDSPSAQGYTPFEGLECRGAVKRTFLRGALVQDNGRVTSARDGRYLTRPTPRTGS
jgi:allantoinase